MPVSGRESSHLLKMAKRLIAPAGQDDNRKSAGKNNIWSNLLKENEKNFPSIGFSNTINDDGKFIKIQLDDEKFTLDNVHPVVIGKILSQHFSGHSNFYKQNGSFFLKTKNSKQFQDIMSLKGKITVNVHENGQQAPKILKFEEIVSRNESKGVVSENSWMNMTTTEIADEINKEQEKIARNRNTKLVKNIHQMTRKSGTERVNSRTFIITFDQPEIPNEVKISGIKYKVRPYKPKPLICGKCLVIGHVKAKCKSEDKEICWKCGASKEDNHECSEVIKCPNCPNDDNNHRPNGDQCPAMDVENVIIDYRMRYKTSYTQAKKAIKILIEQSIKSDNMAENISYSQAASRSSTDDNSNSLREELERKKKKLAETTKLRKELETINAKLQEELLIIRKLRESNANLQQELLQAQEKYISLDTIPMDIGNSVDKRKNDNTSTASNPHKMTKPNSSSSYSVRDENVPEGGLELDDTKLERITEQLSTEDLDKMEEIEIQCRRSNEFCTWVLGRDKVIRPLRIVDDNQL